MERDGQQSLLSWSRGLVERGTECDNVKRESTRVGLSSFAVLSRLQALQVARLERVPCQEASMFRSGELSPLSEVTAAGADSRKDETLPPTLRCSQNSPHVLNWCG